MQGKLTVFPSRLEAFHFSGLAKLSPVVVREKAGESRRLHVVIRVVDHEKSRGVPDIMIFHSNGAIEIVCATLIQERYEFVRHLAVNESVTLTGDGGAQ